MKKLLIVIFNIMSFAVGSSSHAFAQENQIANDGSKPNYLVLTDDKERILKGYIDRSVLETDSSCMWFLQNMKNGKADPAAVEAFKRHKEELKIVVFGGTWCEDTQGLLPVFYHLVDASGFPESSITLVAVDRKKTAPDGLHEKYNVTNVPTFIVLKNGKEVGRVVEFGKYNKIDKELGEIVGK